MWLKSKQNRKITFHRHMMVIRRVLKEKACRIKRELVPRWWAGKMFYIWASFSFRINDGQEDGCLQTRNVCRLEEMIYRLKSSFALVYGLPSGDGANNRVAEGHRETANSGGKRQTLENLSDVLESKSWGCFSRKYLEVCITNLREISEATYSQNGRTPTVR